MTEFTILLQTLGMVSPLSPIHHFCPCRCNTLIRDETRWYSMTNATISALNRNLLEQVTAFRALVSGTDLGLSHLWPVGPARRRDPRPAGVAPGPALWSAGAAPGPPADFPCRSAKEQGSTVCR